GARPKGVAHLGAVEGHPHHGVVDGAVVGDVFEREALDGPPGAGVEDGGHHGRLLRAAPCHPVPACITSPARCGARPFRWGRSGATAPSSPTRTAARRWSSTPATSSAASW